MFATAKSGRCLRRNTRVGRSATANQSAIRNSANRRAEMYRRPVTISATRHPITKGTVNARFARPHAGIARQRLNEYLESSAKGNAHVGAGAPRVHVYASELANLIVVMRDREQRAVIHQNDAANDRDSDEGDEQEPAAP
jgi:hypothetical protein